MQAGAHVTACTRGPPAEDQVTGLRSGCGNLENLPLFSLSQLVDQEGISAGERAM